MKKLNVDEAWGILNLKEEIDVKEPAYEYT